MKNLLTKILKVQSELKPVTKDLNNPYFSSKYFSVNQVISTLKPLLSKHKLVVMQPLDVVGGEDGKPASSLRTYVADPESGETLTFETPLPQGLEPQKFGAAVTYYRRYALVSFFLVEGEEDDDGNSLSEKSNHIKPYPTQYKKI